MRRAGLLWLPENETPRHWALKWIAWWALRHFMNCWHAAGVEVTVDRGPEEANPYARQDAVGLRRDFEYRNHPSMLVHPERLISHKFNKETKRWDDCPWLETMQVSKRTGAGWLADRARLDGTQHVEIVNPKPNKAGEVRVRPNGSIRNEIRLVYGFDAKQSRNDYQAWLAIWEARVAALDYAVIITPVGLLKPEEIPAPIGLVEADPERFFSEQWTKWVGGPASISGVSVVRQPKRLRRPRPISDELWFRMQAECWSSVAQLFEKTLYPVFWEAIEEALKATAESEGA